MILIEEKQDEVRTDGEPQRQMEADEFGGFVTGNQQITENPMQGRDIPQGFVPEGVQQTFEQHQASQGQIHNPGQNSNFDANNIDYAEGTQPVNEEARQPILSG